jgi:hypothetical protein
MNRNDNGASPFASHDELQAAHGEPLGYGLKMHLDYLHEHHALFISNSPFCVLTSIGRDGFPTVSPKGDPKGFVKVLDQYTLLLPDRPGNNQLQTLHNVMDAPKVGLIFLVPGVDESLRVQGTARISTAPEHLAQLAVNGRTPKTALLIDVAEAYVHCGKALKRSKLWDPDLRVPRGAFPTIARMMVDQTGPVPGKTLEELDEFAEIGYRDGLY